ncbi:MAG: toll/interleukin-1 receptor domain-containing protein [Pontiellaceae bacterium]|nr:toll/interleukin-1 receptor domain-containing protein [Pontiellaceae bacterium]
MNFDDARSAVLALLRQKGKVRNSEMLRLVGGSEALLAEIREDLLFEELAEDLRGNVGLRYTGMEEGPVETGDPVKLFISYGRRDASTLAERLEGDLRAAGYEVWRDTREIKPGLDWGEEIVDGLRSAQIVVALMTPHSTRTTRDKESADGVDSVCLGELAYALFSPPPRSVVPVMAKSCEPPLSIFHLDYVDLRQWEDSEEHYRNGFQRLIDGIEAARRGEKRYRSWHHMLDPFDFSGFLHHKRDRFTGRQWLFDKIDVWRRAGQGSTLLIKGDPGTGKSAVVAELVHRNPGS